MTKQKLTLLIAGLLLITGVKAQPFKIGHWREQLPYLHATSVVEGKDRIFCATNNGLFSYGLTDNSLERFSKLNGLNDFGITANAYSASYHVELIGYADGNLDLLFDDNSVINLSDIYRQNIPGNKTINSIYVVGRYAYLACGFGIVVLDLERKEIKDSYFIGVNGTALTVYAVATDNTSIYAATADGVYQASVSDPNLANFNKWTMILKDSTNNGDFNQAVVHNNMLFVNYHKSSADSILAYNGSWGVSLPPAMLGTATNYSFRELNNKLCITNNYSLVVYDNSMVISKYIDATVILNPNLRDGIIDANGICYLADQNKGLLKITGQNVEQIYPNGPNSEQANAMQVVNGTVWVTHGPTNHGWNNQYQYNGFSSFINNNWVTYDGYVSKTPLFTQYNFYDVVGVTVDPSNSNHLFLESIGSGLLEFKDGATVNHYDASNSTLMEQFTGAVKVTFSAYDYNSNLWVANYGVQSVLSVLKTDGTWKRFNFPGGINSGAKTGTMVIDQGGYIWLSIFENVGGNDGLLVFDNNGTIDNSSDDQSAVVPLPARVRSMAMDQDGVIWVGTELGLYVFYPPSTTPQQILIKQDNSYQYLLATESVLAITIDGANRKWVGTENSGVYLFSADGQTQLQHFTKDNSPLFSNTITAVAIDSKSGEVFIGTDKGMLSYQGDAIEGETSCGSLLVYPNPVKKNYDGPIAIKGVVSNGTIKITDVTGNMVFETKSLGGQAIWDGKGFNGERVATGIYLIFSSDGTGENQCVSKVMVAK
jgi:hypothetical protein